MLTRLGTTLDTYIVNMIGKTKHIFNNYKTYTPEEKQEFWSTTGVVTWGGYVGAKTLEAVNEDQDVNDKCTPLGKTAAQLIFGGGATAAGGLTGAFMGYNVGGIGVFGIPFAIGSLYMFNNYQMGKSNKQSNC